MWPPPVFCEAIALLARFIHASIVRSWIWSAGGLPIAIPSPSPSKEKAWPTLPGAYAAFPVTTPRLPLTTSAGETSPCHHATSPAGVTAHDGFVTERTAFELVTKPKAFETTNEYEPALEN